MLCKPRVCPAADVVDPNRSNGMDGFEGIHDPDKYKGIPSLNQEEMGACYLTTEEFPADTCP